MTAALTPALTLDYVHALSADVRAAVVLAAGGECLAGPPALGEAARAVFAELAGGAGADLAPSARAEFAPAAADAEVPPAPRPPAEFARGAAGADGLPAPTLLEGTTDAAAVHAARDERHAIVVVTGPHALSRLTRHDLRSALAALGGVEPIDGTPTLLPHAAVRALLSACEDRFRRPRAV